MKTNKFLKIFLSIFLLMGVAMSCVQDDEYDTPTITCEEPGVTVNATIADVKALYNGQLMQITDDLVIEGYVVSNDEAGNFYRTLHFQDALENPTQGFQLDVDLQDMYTTYQVGRKIYLSVKGLYLDDYNGVIKVGGVYENYGSLSIGRLSAQEAASRLFRACADPAEVTPATTTIDAINDDMINTLIKLENVEVAPASLCQTYAVEGENTNVVLQDCDGNEIILRNSGYSNFYSEMLPNGSGTIVAVLGKYGSDYQLTIRDTNDVEMSNPRCDGSTFTCEAPEANATIQDIKDAYSGDLTQITDDLVVEATITANDETGNFYKFVYIQDETGGIRLRINQTDLYLRGYEVGQKITVSTKDMYIDDYRGEYHLGGIYNGNIGNLEVDDIYKHIFVGEENAPLEPTVVTELSKEHLGKLIQLDDVQFVEVGQNFIVNDSDTNSTLINCDAKTLIVRTSRYASFKDEALPSGNGPIYGILSTYYDTYQLWIRDMDDVAEMTNERCDIYANAVETSLSDIRAMYTGSSLTIEDNIKIKAVITSDDSTGNLYASNAFTQDATAGIALRFSDDHGLALGDEVEVALLGVSLEEYNGLLQLNNIPIENIRSTTAGTLPTPTVITLAEALTGDYEGLLVSIENVEFKDNAKTYSGSNIITDCTDELTMYIRSQATFSGDAVSALNGTITGVMSDYNGAQMYIRDTNDVNFTEDYVDCSGGSAGEFANIYFSEYAEGSSNNKYLEIYNASTETVDLADYGFANVSNDPATPGEYEYFTAFETGATIAPGEVYIIAHPDADATILAKANQTHTYLSNGDDAYALVYGSSTDYTVIDKIGDNDARPSGGWDVAGVTAATKDHTLVRKTSVTQGNTDWVASAGTDADNSEWEVKAQDDWSNLGVR